MRDDHSFRLCCVVLYYGFIFVFNLIFLTCSMCVCVFFCFPPVFIIYLVDSYSVVYYVYMHVRMLVRAYASSDDNILRDRMHKQIC